MQELTAERQEEIANILEKGTLETIKAIFPKVISFQQVFPEYENANALHFVIHNKDFNVFLYFVENFIALGINVDLADDEGETALIHAGRNGKLEHIKVLLQYGADPHRGLKEGTPSNLIDSLYLHGHKDLVEEVKILIQAHYSTKATLPPGLNNLIERHNALKTAKQSPVQNGFQANKKTASKTIIPKRDSWVNWLSKSLTGVLKSSRKDTVTPNQQENQPLLKTKRQ